MAKIDRPAIDAIFSEKYRKGAILRFYMRCDDPKLSHKYKYGIVLNKDCQAPDALLAITTSRFEKFESGYGESDILRIEPSAYPCFECGTIINLREIRVETVEALKQLGVDQKLTFEGNLDSSDMTEIETKVQGSMLIETKYKIRIA
jgi:hypothetical protein